MTPAEIRCYVGKPYELGADGPESYDCRGLVCRVLRMHFGRDVPVLPVGPQLGHVWAENMSTGAWETVTRPRHGDAVVLRGGNDPHVGIYLESAGPGVLHAFEACRQVVWTPFDRLRMLGFSRLSFVRCHLAVAESGPHHGSESPCASSSS